MNDAVNNELIQQRGAPKQKPLIHAPAINLPKGGGAVRGMGEKFAANPVTGTASLTVPIYTSPGRAGFGPQLSLSYDSGAGNGPFGFGWSLSLPSITRKTDKGLPRYRNDEEPDEFILSGAEDLVPLLVNNHGRWEREVLPVREVNHQSYRVERYRPRIEGLFARIERWTRETEPDDVFWRTISKDNITTWYGRDTDSRIIDPADPSRIFSWLICESHDDKGNVLVYRYKRENSDGVGSKHNHLYERNRSDLTRSANRYLKYIRYGNHEPYRPKLLEADPWPEPRGASASDASLDWFFEVVFDYGEHDDNWPTPTDNGVWTCRDDPFSSYRPGFEVRTYRLCRRILMFHHFPDQEKAGIGANCLVRSTDFTYRYKQGSTDTRNPIHTLLLSVAQTGYARRGDEPYTAKSLPPMEFQYSQPIVQDEIRTIDPKSLENLPIGLDGSTYQWVDLDGEGIPGILTEQAGAWFFKPNLSPVNFPSEGGNESGTARFGPMERVAEKPSLAAISVGPQQLIDLAGDGQLDLVELNAPTAGFYERTEDERWASFRAFESYPNLDWVDPNLRFVDLTGDGHADVLITEDEVLTWYGSLAEAGFAPAQKVRKSLDEEHGPRLVFADGTQSIYLADLSGDGLTDLVRIRNGEVCYWPNLGYGRFGAKVTMDNAPWFDVPDQFDQRRIRLADIDGTGPTDIIYLAGDGVHLYFNQSGNGWRKPHILQHFPHIDNLATVTVTDLFGNGTACLVWSSPAPRHAQAPMRYIDLMGGQKPHLLIKTVNNLGTETCIEYTASTRFYLADKLAGTPWITRIPFPVHVVKRVEIYDHISRNCFVTRYAYHHGYYDGVEREFRGFGLVEQWDTEQFASLAPVTAKGLDAREATNRVAATHVPPVLTKTWFHTGAYLERNHISDHLAAEYYRAPALTDPETSALLLPDTLLPPGLASEEEREACRALKGSMLRQEIYALDGSDKEPHPYSVTEQNFSIECLQPQERNPHAVFFTHARETLSYHYERRPDDPRVGQTLTLQVDPYGNVLKSLTIGYGRRTGKSPLAKDDRDKQEQCLMTFAENEVTHPIDDPTVYPDDYRTPLRCEIRAYEITGFEPSEATARFSFEDFAGNGCQILSDLPETRYEQPTNYTARQKRLIERIRTLYRKGDLTALLPKGRLDPPALSGESYRLAFTPGLLNQVYVRDGTSLLTANRSEMAEGGYVDLDGDDHWWMPSGRMFFSSSADPANPARTAAEEKTDAQAHFYLPQKFTDPFGNSSLVVYDPYDLLVTQTQDALANTVSTVNDYRVLQPKKITDPNGNRSEAAFDALGLVVGTAVMGKVSETLGDFLDDSFAPEVTPAQLDEFMAQPREATGNLTGSSATQIVHDLLRNATTRIVYDLDRFMRLREPPFAATIARETHVSDLADGKVVKLQISFSYSDGFGREIQKKIQAEPGPGPLRDDNGRIIVGPNGQPVPTPNIVNPRWVGSGWTLFNNKGKPVRQYEPFFTDTHRFEFDVRIGVSPVIFYDPIGRIIATLHPNHTYEKALFDPWQQTSYDVNDTCAPRNAQTGDPRTDPDIQGYVRAYFETQPAFWQTWHAQRIDGALGENERAAAVRAAAHADTPATAHFDPLGRPFMTVACNRIECAGHDLDGIEESFATRIEFDIEGNQRAVCDERQLPVDYLPFGPLEQRVVMRYAYSMASPGRDENGQTAATNRIFQLSMEAGARWLLNDVTGKPIRLWDGRGHDFKTSYDALRRPVAQYVQGTTHDSDPRTLNPPNLDGLLVDKIEYGESLANAESFNLRTRIYRHFDSAGIVTNARLDDNGNPGKAYDFKGNLLHSTRRLIRDYTAIPDWLTNPRLDEETFEGSTRYDALNRPIQSIAPYSSQARAKRNVFQPVFNEANLLERVDVWLECLVEPENLLDPDADQPSPVGVVNIDYDAKGQRLRIDYKNGASTHYHYDSETFRLMQLRTVRGNKAAAACTPVLEPRTCQDPPAICSRLATSACILQDLGYTYDPAGNITHIEDSTQQIIYYKNRIVEPSNDYTYDALYRLIQASGREHLGQTNGQPNPPTPPDAFNAFHTRQEHPSDGNAMGRYTERYLYDAVGNLLQMQHRGSDPAHGWTRGYVYEESSSIEPEKYNNALTRTTIGNADPIRELYGYDLHGNMNQMSHLSAMAWDYKDQLQKSARQVINNGETAETTYYVYDASGQRVRKVTERHGGTRMKERLYLGGFEIYREYNGSGQDFVLERETLHIMDDRQRIALVETRTQGSDPAPEQLIRYQLGNHLGSSSLELDDDGWIISYEEYTPYGSSSYQAVRNKTETPKRYRYTGKECDEESGIYYYGARYYASWLGRWCSADPDDSGLRSNSYSYVLANPLKFIDPAGSKEFPPELLSSIVERELPGLKSGFAILDLKSQDINVANEFIFARYKPTGQLVIFQGGSGEFFVPKGYELIGHSHVAAMGGDPFPGPSAADFITSKGKEPTSTWIFAKKGISHLEYNPKSNTFTETTYWRNGEVTQITHSYKTRGQIKGLKYYPTEPKDLGRQTGRLSAAEIAETHKSSLLNKVVKAQSTSIERPTSRFWSTLSKLQIYGVQVFFAGLALTAGIFEKDTTAKALDVSSGMLGLTGAEMLLIANQTGSASALSVANVFLSTAGVLGIASLLYQCTTRIKENIELGEIVLRRACHDCNDFQRSWLTMGLGLAPLTPF